MSSTLLYFFVRTEDEQDKADMWLRLFTRGYLKKWAN